MREMFYDVMKELVFVARFPGLICLLLVRAWVFLWPDRAGLLVTVWGRAGLCLRQGRAGLCLRQGRAGLCLRQSRAGLCLRQGCSV
jgi:hypothetical protein